MVFENLGLVNFVTLLNGIVSKEPSASDCVRFEMEISKWKEEEREDNLKRRMFEFGDGSQFMALKYHIVNVHRDWIDHQPVLILNEMPEEVNLKDNPLKNVHLYYEDDLVRDRDYARLKLILK